MTNQSYVYGWLYRRLEWEHMLAELHARALAAEVEPVPGKHPIPVPGERPTRERYGRLRRAWSPVRGMSARRFARKIPA